MSLTLISGKNNGQLSFVALTKKAFEFLLKLDFVVTKTDTALVRYESSKVFINIFQERLSYHIDAEIGRIAEGDLYSLYETLSVMAPSEINCSKYQTTDPEVLERCLKDIADVFERYLKHLLLDENSVFDKLQAGVSRSRLAYTLKAQFGPIIDKADRAWEAKEMGQALSLYSEAEQGLDETRIKRLEYLRKHC